MTDPLAPPNLETAPSIDPIILEMHSQNERGAAITGTVFLEQKLCEAIWEQWPPISRTMRERLFRGYGPLASFSSRIDVATAMGVLSNETRADFLQVKRIRNDAAHTGTPFSFDLPAIVTRLDAIICIRAAVLDEHAEGLNRNRFTTAIKNLSAYLYFAGEWKRSFGHKKVMPHLDFTKLSDQAG